MSMNEEEDLSIPAAAQMTNPAMEAAARNPRLAILALARETIAVLAGGELAHGGSCTMCGLGTVGVLRDTLRTALSCVGVNGEIVQEDLEDVGRLGPFGSVAVQARAAENEQEYGLAYRVREFHARFGHGARRKPELPTGLTDDEARHRARLVTEEYLEFMTSIFGGGSADLDASMVLVESTLGDIIDLAAVRVDLPELVDAIEDLKYVLEGTHATAGVDGEPAGKAVHAANMAKEPVLDAEGKPDPLSKPTKPAGWAPPDVAAILRGQGWPG